MLGPITSTQRYLDAPQPIPTSAPASTRRRYRGHIRKGLWALGACWLELLSLTGQLEPGMSGWALWQMTWAILLVAFGVLSTEYLPMDVEEVG